MRNRSEETSPLGARAKRTTDGTADWDPETLRAHWPFAFVVRSDGNRTDWVALHAPLVSESRREEFADYRRRGLRFVGMCSFAGFPSRDEPSELRGPDEVDYGSVCEAWCHCFREPEHALPRGAPRALLSLSDFIDPAVVRPSDARCSEQASRHDTPRQFVGGLGPSYDFVYLGATEPWKQRSKNWDLARRCIPRLCRELGLRGLALGVPRGSFPGVPGLTIGPWLPRESFFDLLAQCRFLFAPYAQDASPRVLAEALCLDVPILVHEGILGGWKYVTKETGVFFADEHDVVAAARACLEESFDPRSWFRAHHGSRRAGLELAALLARVDASIDPEEPLGFSESCALEAEPRY
ncbi:MAG: glycosyltransferase [Planctomycetes bacterium]|nr:glycosyltransferase [Planctomycetota bacterium]